MPNLAGIWDPGLSQASIRDRLNKQLLRIRIPKIDYREYSIVRPGFGVGLLDHGLLENGRQPAESRERDTSLMIDGEIYNAEELKKQFRNDLDVAALSDPDLILKLIETFGLDIVGALRGLFVLVLYDAASERLTLISDRCGFRPLFYLQRGNSLVFGSELKALTSIDPGPRRLDEVGTLELFAYGSQIGDRTWLHGYFRLPPATVLTADRSAIRSAAYWKYAYDEDAPRLDQTTYVTQYATRLDRAVERCTKGSGRLGVFLSGGYDSRSVAASIRDHRRPIAAFTFGQPESRDVRFATILARRLSLDHVKLHDADPYLARSCREIVWRTEGMLPFAQTTSLHYHSIIRQAANIVLVGFFGEASGSHVWPALLTARTRPAVMKTMFAHMLAGRSGMLPRIFKPDFLRSALDEARRVFDASFDGIENDRPLNIADAWSCINVYPRSTYFAPSVDRHLFEIRAPLLDNDLVDFLLTIPPYARLEQRVYKKMIYSRFPEIRDVPCTNSGRPINPNFLTEYATMTLRYLARRSWRPVRNALGIKPGLGRESLDLNAAVRREPELAADVLTPLLADGALPAEIFDHEAIRKLVSLHYERKRDVWEPICLLISLGLAARFLLHDDPSEVPDSMLARRPDRADR